ncbi:MAG: polyprenyl synthetase family protein [Candidatus Nanoarchaeia archaeon]
MQPKNKSLANYISEGYFFATGNYLPNGLDIFDRGILRLDDILDESDERNGKPCKYITNGINKTIIDSLTNIAQTSIKLDKLMNETKPEFRYKALLSLQKLTISIYRGEIIDKNVKTLKDYFRMITLFTGQHIAKGVEIGNYIANRTPEKKLLSACRSAGRIRQIIDDYEDYYCMHHEPFGDFLNHKNRLPELLFAGDRYYAEELIKLGKHNLAREYLLSEEVRNTLFNYCANEEIKIRKNDKRALKFIVDYNKIIS